MIKIESEGDKLHYRHRAPPHLMLVLIMRGWAAIGLALLVPVLMAVNTHQGFSGFVQAGTLECARATAMCTVDAGTRRAESIPMSWLAGARIASNPARANETRLLVGDGQGEDRPLSLYQWDAQAQAKLAEVAVQLQAFSRSEAPTLRVVFPVGTGPKPIVYVVLPVLVVLMAIRCFRSFTSVDAVVDRGAGTVTLRRRRLGIPKTTVLQLSDIARVRTAGVAAAARVRPTLLMPPLMLVLQLYGGGRSVDVKLVTEGDEEWKVFEGFASPAIGIEAGTAAKRLAEFLGVSVVGT